MTTIALIIGGASGIGAASARALADRGATVAVADLQGEGAETLASTLKGEGHRGFQVDASVEASLTDLFDRVETLMGPIGVLVVAAGTPGYVGGVRPTIRTMPTEAWDSVMALNVRGPMICLREMFNRRAAMPSPDARVVLIGSMAAQQMAINSPPSYVASKGALHALLRSAAGEGAPLGITVNAVAPGAIDTPMLRNVMSKDRDEAYFGKTVAGRAGSADEIAAAVAFLASPEASYINGAVLDVNGGLLMR
ncbi:SDR family NAD(P)-dependent oxidoreductase [soil metagenome]